MFCIFHFMEKNEFIHVIEKESLLNKKDFVVNSNAISESMHPHNSNRIASISRKIKKKIDDLMNMDKEDIDKDMEVGNDAISLDSDLVILEGDM
jgi:hypothetical protein